MPREGTPKGWAQDAAQPPVLRNRITAPNASSLLTMHTEIGGKTVTPNPSKDTYRDRFWEGPEGTQHNRDVALDVMR